MSIATLCSLMFTYKLIAATGLFNPYTTSEHLLLNFMSDPLFVMQHAISSFMSALPAKSKMATRGPQNGRQGLEKCLPPGTPVNFCKISF